MKKHLNISSIRRSQGINDNLIYVQYVEDNPDPKEIYNGKLLVVGVKGKYVKWAYMKCPCGCQDTLMLSLQKGTRPRWRFFTNKLNLATLSPSIWKFEGCKSHFLLKRGKVIWVTKGISPRVEFVSPSRKKD